MPGDQWELLSSLPDTKKSMTMLLREDQAFNKTVPQLKKLKLEIKNKEFQWQLWLTVTEK